MGEINRRLNVAILMFDEVEVLDFAGPFEVFSVAGREQHPTPFLVYTVAENPGSILARNHLSLNPQHTFIDCPTPDILVIPGGWGTRKAMLNPNIIEWVRERAKKATLVLSVCTGALVLGKAGLLDGLEATTHYSALQLLREVAPKARVLAKRRYVDNGKVITSAGISAGMDMCLHVVERLLGPAHATETAAYMEYERIEGA